MENYLHIILSTSAVYIFIILAFRMVGKTEIAQLSITDFIFILLLSNAVQNAMVGSDSSLGGGLLAASVLFGLNISLKKMKYYFPSLRKAIEGEPILLIYKGKIQMQNCKKNNISKEELLQIVREHGSESIDDINSLILETDGNISVISHNYKHHSVRKIVKN